MPGRHWYRVPRVGHPDPAIMDVAFARRAVALLQGGGIQTEVMESGAGHHIDPAALPAITRWVAQVVPPAG